MLKLVNNIKIANSIVSIIFNEVYSTTRVRVGKKKGYREYKIPILNIFEEESPGLFQPLNTALQNIETSSIVKFVISIIDISRSNKNVNIDFIIGDDYIMYYYDLDKQKWLLTFGDDIYREYINQDIISLFHHYFQAYKILVEQYLPFDQKQQIINTDWWPKFLLELPKLEAIYKELVAKGEIEEVGEVSENN